MSIDPAIRPAPSTGADERFRQLLDLLPAAIYTCAAPSGLITFYNAHAADLWGRAPRVGDTDERFCGSFRLWHPDGTLLAHADTPMALAVREGRRARNEEVVIERPDGSRVTVLVNIDPILDASGRVTGAINVFHDATDLKVAEKARSELAAIVESSDDAIVSKDLTGVIRSWNHGAERLFGYSAAEAVGRSVTMLIPRGREDEEPRILNSVRRGERVDHYETIRQRKDGTLVDVSLTVSPMRGAHGEIVGASKIARDISERREAAAQLAADHDAVLRLQQIGQRFVRAESDFTENLGEALDAAIWITRADMGTVQIYDERLGALRIVANRGFEAPFLSFYSRVTSEHASACGAAFCTGERMIVEDVTRSPLFAGHASLDVMLAAGVKAVQSTPLLSSGGLVLGLISTHYRRPYRPSDRALRLLDLLVRQTADYLERKRAEDQRDELLRSAQLARRDAEAANRAKDEFLAMLGHELRNPLSAVRNAVAAATLDESSRGRALEIARRQTDQLGRIVDDLLDIARITRGRVPLRKHRVWLRELLESAVDAAQSLMDERGHTLTLEAPPEVQLDADPARVEQAIMNLLTNAAKYTSPGGTVLLAADLEGDTVRIRVCDNGIGIAPEVLPHVFDLFAQGERPLDRAQGGLGIGLTLARRIVELHGGSVEARSAGIGCGAEFAIRLPAAPSLQVDHRAAPREAAQGRRPGRNARVLMVEDNPDSAETLGMILELLGHHVRVVHDGVAALDAARANVPDIVLIDIGLPGMNGYEVAEAMRRDPQLGRIVLVALTGYGRPEDKARAMAAGFDYHLVKPVDVEALGDLVGRLGTSAPAGRPDSHVH